VGKYPAPDFFSIHKDNGQVRVIKDLMTDTLRSDKYTVSGTLIIIITTPGFTNLSSEMQNHKEKS